MRKMITPLLLAALIGCSGETYTEPTNPPLDLEAVVAGFGDRWTLNEWGAASKEGYRLTQLYEFWQFAEATGPSLAVEWLKQGSEEPDPLTLSIEDLSPTLLASITSLVINYLWNGTDATNFPDGNEWFVRAQSFPSFATPEYDQNREMMWRWNSQGPTGAKYTGLLRFFWRREGGAEFEDEDSGQGIDLVGIDGITQLSFVGVMSTMALQAADWDSAWPGPLNATQRADFEGVEWSYYYSARFDDTNGTRLVMIIMRMPYNYDTEGQLWMHPDNDPDEGFK